MTCPRYLYKFVTPARLDVLERRLIRFTQPSALNDPFELQPIFEYLFPDDALEEALTPSFEMVEESLRNEWASLSSEQQRQAPIESIITFLRENPTIIEGFLAQNLPMLRRFVTAFAPRAKEIMAETLRSKVGILSLSEDPTHPLLWAHYAQSHKGFAIEFDVTHSFFNRRRKETDEFYHLRKVIYADRSMKGRALRDLDGDDLLVTKASAWSYEAEWRMLVPLDDADRTLVSGGDTIYLFSFPLDAVSGVVLGAKAEPELLNQVAQTFASFVPHARLMRAALDAEDQRIVISPWE